MHSTTHNRPPLSPSAHVNSHKDTHLYSHAVPGLGLYCWPCVHSAEYTAGSMWRFMKKALCVCVYGCMDVAMVRGAYCVFVKKTPSICFQIIALYLGVGSTVD